MDTASLETVRFYNTDTASIKNTSTLTFTPLSLNNHNHSVYPFWLENLTALFQITNFIPNSNSSTIERLNGMMCAILIISACLFVFKYPLWWLFLIWGIIANLIMWKWESTTFSHIGNDYIVNDLYTPQSHILPVI